MLNVAAAAILAASAVSLPAQTRVSMGGIDRRLQELTAKEGERQGLMPPDDLWHAIIMFTTGVVATRELARFGRPYESYESRYKQIGPVERSAFERDWQPYLDGTTSFDQALHNLVRDAR